MGKYMRGYRFRHWLSTNKLLADRIEESQIPVILESVRKGDPEAIREMILGHMRLAMGLVARYNKPNIADELVGAAFYGVVNAVNRIANGHLKHDNPTAYIVTFIHGEIKRVLRGSNVSIKALHLHHLKERVEGGVNDELNAANIPGEYPDTTIDLEEEINSLCEDNLDEAIIRMLRLGYDGTDIARSLCVSQSTISRRANRIRRIYKELENV
jgi:RNA polymerase sigma factor (sigma-70 family)